MATEKALILDENLESDDQPSYMIATVDGDAVVLAPKTDKPAFKVWLWREDLEALMGLLEDA